MTFIENVVFELRQLIFLAQGEKEAGLRNK